MVNLPVELGHHGGVDMDPVPEIAQAQVFVGRMLVVVVIDDGQADHRYLQTSANTYSGTLPPIMGITTTGADRRLCSAAAMTALPVGADMSVRSAG